MPSDYYYCRLGRHLWPSPLDGRPRGPIPHRNCRECMSKRAVAPTPGDAFKRSRMWLGDPSTGRPDVDEEAQELRDAAWQRDEARKTVELENRAARKAAKEGKRFVTSGDARRMWLALDPHGSKR